jgi:uncharacterized lipoprotein
MHNGIYFHHTPDAVVSVTSSEVLETITLSLGEDRYNTTALTLTSDRDLWQQVANALATVGVHPTTEETPHGTA